MKGPEKILIKKVPLQNLKATTSVGRTFECATDGTFLCYNQSIASIFSMMSASIWTSPAATAKLQQASFTIIFSSPFFMKTKKMIVNISAGSHPHKSLRQ